MNFDGWMGFERSSTGRMIQVWEDDGNGTALSTKVEVPVATLQNYSAGPVPGRSGPVRGCYETRFRVEQGRSASANSEF
jgi:hypothetical protein